MNVKIETTYCRFNLRGTIEGINTKYVLPEYIFKYTQPMVSLETLFAYKEFEVFQT